MSVDDHKTSWEWMPAQPDPRTDNYPLMKSFLPTAAITVVYVLGTYFWRKNLKKNPPKESKKTTEWTFLQYIMVLYNFCMVIYSSAIVMETIIVWIKSGSGISCLTYSKGNTALDLRVVRVGYAFYFSKIVELLDTLFFLLRGKVDQITFLHVFHHAAMPPSIWWGIRYAPATPGVTVSFPLINSFIHVLMYTYYGLAACGAYKYLWWKEYLTLAQMIQFCFLFLHQSQVFLPGNTHKDPRIFPLSIMIYSIIFLILFGNFYIKAYWKKQRLWKLEQEKAMKKKS